MSKMSDALRPLGFVNTYDILKRFGTKGETDVAIDFHGAESRACKPAGTYVWSLSHATDPNAAWYDHGKMCFVGKRAESMPKAIAWATEKYGIEEWVPCPMMRGVKIPKEVKMNIEYYLGWKK